MTITSQFVSTLRGWCRSRSTRWIAVCCAVLCLGLGLVLPGRAVAEQGGDVLLSVNGADFTSTPAGPLLDTSSLAPGRSRTAQLGVRSAFGVGTKLKLSLIDVQDDDNGCTRAEALVDNTCGAGQGDLGNALVVTIDFAAKQSGPYRTVWSGSPTQLEESVAFDPAVPAKGERWLRMTAALPPTVANAVQSDSIDFGVRAVLYGNGAHGSSEIAGEHAGKNSAPPHRVDASGVAGLAVTGLSVVLLVVGAIALIAAGTAMTFAGIARRRQASEAG